MEFCLFSLHYVVFRTVSVACVEFRLTVFLLSVVEIKAKMGLSVLKTSNLKILLPFCLFRNNYLGNACYFDA